MTRRTSNQRRSRDDVVVRAQVLHVDVLFDARIVGRVERCTGNALWVVGPTTCDDHVDTLRVVLCAVGHICGMKSDDFVTHDVVACLEVLWDGRGPTVTVGDELVGCPDSGSVGGTCRLRDAQLVNLEEFERRGIDLGAVAIATGHVGHDGPMVRIWPSIPLKLDIISSSGGGALGTRSGLLVTDDFGAVVIVWIDVAVITVTRIGPAHTVPVGDGTSAGKAAQCQGICRSGGCIERILTFDH